MADKHFRTMDDVDFFPPDCSVNLTGFERARVMKIDQFLLASVNA
jgi:hypothetical protein